MPILDKLGKRIILILALFIFTLDQTTKAWVLRNLAENEQWAPIPALSRYFTITHVTNTGAAFGLFRDQSILFVIIAIVVIIAILVYSRYLSHGQFWVQFSLGLQLGGAAGNLVDRVRLGRVTDFITIGIDDKTWPTFNIADSAIVVGVIILALIVFTEKEEPREDVTDAQGA